jgi:copper chaperone CopZ
MKRASFLSLLTVVAAISVLAACSGEAAKDDKKEDKKAEANQPAEEEIDLANARVFVVEGMSCEHHCVPAVEKAIVGIDGVEGCKVVLKENKAYVVADKETCGDETIISAIEDAGDFTAKVADEAESTDEGA